MHPGVNGKKFPEKPAIIMAGSGRVVTHGQLNELSNQGAHLFRSLGLKPGDSIAIMMENHHLFFPIVFAAWRSGLRYTTISWRLQPSEVEYIVKDCDAKVLITSKFLEQTANDLNETLDGVHRFMLDGTTTGYLSYEEAIQDLPNDSIEDECQGGSMLYSSGSTGTGTSSAPSGTGTSSGAALGFGAAFGGAAAAGAAGAWSSVILRWRC